MEGEAAAEGDGRSNGHGNEEQEDVEDDDDEQGRKSKSPDKVGVLIISDQIMYRSVVLGIQQVYSMCFCQKPLFL